METAMRETAATGNSHAASAVLCAAIAFGALVVQTTAASAVSSTVRRACKSDYYTYCSRYAVGSSELRRCMSDNGANLSKGCLEALIAAGEVASSEVNRRRAASR